MRTIHCKLGKLFLLGFAAILFLQAVPGYSAIDEYEFSTDEEQASFRHLTNELRCPRCLNSSLSGSDAPIAADLRAEIYEQIKAGQSEKEIVDFMRARYGDFITYKPPFNAGTAILWLGPVVLLVMGFIMLRRVISSSKESDKGELTDQERESLAKILEQENRL